MREQGLDGRFVELNLKLSDCGLSRPIPEKFIQQKDKATGCAVDGCDRPYFCRGLCHKHYARLSYHGLIDKLNRHSHVCTVPGCGKKYFAIDMCQYHYRQNRLDTSRAQARNWHHKKKADNEYVLKMRKRRGIFRDANRELCRLENELYRKSEHSRFVIAVSISKRHGKEWTIAEPDYLSLIKNNCFYCGSSPHGRCRGGSYLDRVDWLKGYHLDNVVPCCGKCNKLKNNLLTKEEMVAVANLLKTMRGGFVWKK